MNGYCMIRRLSEPVREETVVHGAIELELTRMLRVAAYCPSKSDRIVSRTTARFVDRRQGQGLCLRLCMNPAMTEAVVFLIPVDRRVKQVTTFGVRFRTTGAAFLHSSGRLVVTGESDVRVLAGRRETSSYPAPRSPSLTSDRCHHNGLRRPAAHVPTRSYQ